LNISRAFWGYRRIRTPVPTSQEVQWTLTWCVDAWKPNACLIPLPRWFQAQRSTQPENFKLQRDKISDLVTPIAGAGFTKPAFSPKLKGKNVSFALIKPEVMDHEQPIALVASNAVGNISADASVDGVRRRFGA
jgi:hypothetical protein